MRICAISCLLILIPGVAAAADNGQFDISLSIGNTIWYDKCFSLDLKIANDVAMSGFQIPMTFTSTGGVTWTFNEQYTNAWGPSKIVTHIIGARMGDPAATFDIIPGLLVIETYLPNKLLVGAGVLHSPGMPPGSLQQMLSVHLTADNANPMNEGTFCVDVTKAVGAADFVFSDVAGSALAVTFLDNDHNGIWCWPTEILCCGPCPTITSGGDIAACHGHPGSVDFTATETVDPQSITWGYEVISGTGSVSFSNATGPATTITYTPGPGEPNNHAHVLIKVGDPYQSFNSCCGSWYEMDVNFYEPGDANNDGAKNIGDAVYIVNYIFKGGPAPNPLELGDFNCDGAINIGDAIRQVNYLFKFGPVACCPW